MDLLIFNKIKNSDIQAYEKLFKEYYKPLCLYAYNFVERLEVAEEIVQDVFYMIWKEREGLQIIVSLKSYLYKAVRNKSLQHIEHLQVRERYQHFMMEVEHENYASNPVNSLEYKQLDEYISKTLDQLPERRRKIFNMSRFEGKKYTEIAEELSISIKTVEIEISKTLEALKKNIGIYIH